MNGIPIHTRCYVDNHDDNRNLSSSNYQINSNNSTVLVFDTETTPDQYQNLLFGSCGIWVNGHLKKFYLFYADWLKQAQIRKILAYAKRHNFELMSRHEFVEKVFYPYVYQARAKCVGFNLPFDLSRLAISYGKARKFHGGFSLKLSENPAHPNIRIKSINSKASFIEFSKPVRKKSQKKKPHYKGFFLDLKTFSFVLTNKSYNLGGALQDFECKLQKPSTQHHGKISKQYLDYNVNDTKSTYELYQKCMQRYQTFLLSKQPNQLFSPASIGKAYLEKIEVKPFLEKNSDFPKEILGYTMMSYYGGRVECRIRKKPVKVTYLDFTSMYPTCFILLEMYNFLISDKITFYNSKKKTQKFLNKITLSDINKKETWKHLTTICKIKPDNDILPVRSKYGAKHATNIGVNYLKSTDDTCLWYTLPDLIASKLLTGKTPVIEDAISFSPIGIQKGLQEIEILNGIKLKAGKDFIKTLIEERLKIKSDKNQNLKQNILKIIANSASYGIFIQLDRGFEANSGRKRAVSAYGLESFNTQVERPERQGRYFNPIISVFLTASSRLILAAAELLVLQNGGYVAYCDTDSIFVSPKHAQLVQDFFRSLSPYSQKTEMFKVETGRNNVKLDDVLFFGISSKRYVLYDYESGTEKIKIYKHSEHGLGHLLDIDKENWWKDILKINYQPKLTEKILKEYENKFAVSKITINSPQIIKRFESINKNKTEKNKIKPFNFALVGTGYRKDTEKNDTIIPLLPYFDKKHRQSVPYIEFYDYKTGKLFPNENSLDTVFYWKPLSLVFLDYINHPEPKLKGDVGFLKRLFLSIQKSSVHYIGKESNEIEESKVLGVSDTNYTEYQDIESKILQIKPAQAFKLGISRTNLITLKKKIRNKIPIRLQARTSAKISRYSGPILMQIYQKKRR